jgi:predicted PurR-regulated permease PerM
VTVDKKFLESKKALALCIVLGVVLVLGILGIIFHAEVTSWINGIIAYASTHQVAQGAQDAIAKYKTPAQTAVQKAESFFVDKSAETSEQVCAGLSEAFNEEDRYAGR